MANQDGAIVQIAAHYQVKISLVRKTKLDTVIDNCGVAF